MDYCWQFAAVFLVCVSEVVLTTRFVVLQLMVPAVKSGLLQVNGTDYAKARQPLHYWAFVSLGFLVPVPFAVGSVVLAFFLPSKCGVLFPL